MLLSMGSKRGRREFNTTGQLNNNKEPPDFPPYGSIIVHFHQQCMEVLFSPHPLQNLSFVDFCTFAILSDLKLYLTGALIGVSLISSDA